MRKLFSILLLLTFLFIGKTNSQWTLINTGYSQLLTSVSAVDDNLVWICGHLGRVCKSTNGGVSWSVYIVTPDTLTLVNIFGIDQNSALVVAKDYSPSVSSVWKTTNGGSSWQQVLSQPGGTINAIEIQPNGTGMIMGNPVGSRWSLWRTTNYGASWDSTGMYVAGPGSSIENCLYSSGTDYWFGANNGKLYHSSDGGLSWSFQTLGSSQIIGIWLNGQTGIATSGTSGYITTNGGTNWSAITIPGSGFQKPIAGYGTNYWMVTRGSVSIYNTTNSGTNWDTFTSTPSLGDVGVSRTGNQVWVATLSEYVLKQTVNGITQISGNIPEKFSLSQNYPNPFNPVTNMVFEIPKSAYVSLTVYDINGKVVEVLVSSKLNAGRYKADWNSARYSSGVYFYRISSGDFTQTKKMILVK